MAEQNSTTVADQESLDESATDNMGDASATDAFGEMPQTQASFDDGNGYNPVARMLGDAGRVLASLKITVALFAMAIFLILTGTLAQTKLNMWEVINQYFHSWFVFIKLDVFFPESFFPNLPEVKGAFPFPGGALIGSCMAINLVAAHSLRFKAQASGRQLLTGIGILGLGGLITALVIIRGHSQTHVLGEMSAGMQDAVWKGINLLIAAIWVGLVMTACRLKAGQSKEWLATITGIVGFGALGVGLLVYGKDAQFDGSTLRILWQLIQGFVAAAVLLVGCILVFGKRGGVVLLHSGVALMMFGEMFVSHYAVEENMSITEGETSSHAEDIRTTEIAVWDDSGEEAVGTLIPREQFAGGKTVSHEALPFDLRIEKYFKNHDVVDRDGKTESPATAGFGLTQTITEEIAGAGASNDSSVDLAGCYVTLLKKGTDEAIDTYMLSQIFSVSKRPERVEYQGKVYRLFLQFRHTPKPYSITLVDVARKDYVGTDTAQDFHSDIRLVDKNHPGEGVKKRIWMNNPLRYAGETFYQSQYFPAMPGGKERTVLQVVKNRGWMIPYVACMLVVVGMFAHFTIALNRFLKRRAAVSDAIYTAVNLGSLAFLPGWIWVFSPAKPTDKGNTGNGRRKRLPRGSSNDQPGSEMTYVPIAVLILGVVMTISNLGKAWRSVGDSNFDLKGFGELPVAFQGRVKPFDTLARNSLRAISNSDEFEEDGEKQPAIKFILDVMCHRKEALDHQVFRVPELELQDKLGLDRRKRFRYSYSEIEQGLMKLRDEYMAAEKKKPQELTLFERKLLQLFRRVDRFRMLQEVFSQPPLRPAQQLNKENFRQVFAQFQQDWPNALRFIGAVERSKLPRPIPAVYDKEPNRITKDPVFHKPWQAYATATAKAYCDMLLKQDGNEVVYIYERLRRAYFDGPTGATAFNKAVDDYKRMLANETPDKAGAVGFEAFFNRFNPFYVALQLYVVAFILSALSWLFAPAMWNRSAYWLLVFTFCLHTFALLGRIYISGRPPVTNLYSSAVFIGWGCVGLALLLEMFYRLGIGNFVSSVAGFGTLLVSIYLGADGDTFAVLQAVLDTQFWLSTHVVTVTFGYSTTFVAGLLGIQYIVTGVFTRRLDSNTAKSTARMIYGVLCFAMFFSFIGTVLGGLWADDSWGRFWGWDPKENGALIIVLWNALILHARWDGMVRDRGMAVLAVLGNIVTSWSWFGVNELGVGLHSYGFTEGVLSALGLFGVSQLLIAGVGCIPKARWLSSRPKEA